MSVIHSRSISRKIARKRAGLQFLDQRRSRPDGLSGMQDTALRRTVLLPATNRVIHDPTHGYATRVPATKNAKTARGFTMFNDVKVYHESELEHRNVLRLQARNDVVSVHSQFPVIRYADAGGVLREHVVDFYVEYSDGYRQACIVKQERKRAEMEDLIERLEASRNPKVVDGIKLLTEVHGSHAAAHNAKMVLWSRDYHHQEDVDELLAVVRLLKSWVRFGELLRNCSSIPRRRAAIWRLIDAGILFSSTGEKITELSWLGYATEGGPTGLLG